MPRRESRNSGLRACTMAARIAAVSGGASITLWARSRPCWRMPTLTVGRAKEAASMMPLEELPTIASTWPKRTRVINRGHQNVGIEYLSSAMLYNLAAPRRFEQELLIHVAQNTWQAEAQ